jgi:hypothetical protein
MYTKGFPFFWYLSIMIPHTVLLDNNFQGYFLNNSTDKLSYSKVFYLNESNLKKQSVFWPLWYTGVSECYEPLQLLNWPFFSPDIEYTQFWIICLATFLEYLTIYVLHTQPNHMNCDFLSCTFLQEYSLWGVAPSKLVKIYWCFTPLLRRRLQFIQNISKCLSG